MSDTEKKDSSENNDKKTLSVGKTLSIKKPTDSGNRSPQRNHVAVEVKRKRPNNDGRPNNSSSNNQNNVLRKNQPDKGRQLTGDEFEARLKAFQESQKNMQQSLDEKQKREHESNRLRQEQSKFYEQQQSLEILKNEQSAQKISQEEEKKALKEAKAEEEQISEKRTPPKRPELPQAPILDDFPVEKTSTKQLKGDVKQHVKRSDFDEADTEASVVYRADSVKKAVIAPKKTVTVNLPAKKFSRQQLNRVLDDGFEEKERSLASMKRHRQKAHKQVFTQEVAKVVREVIITETINVGELASRMAVRSADVVKSLMKLGVFATINQSIDADTAELICTEFGHTPKRVTEDDYELDALNILDNLSGPNFIFNLGHGILPHTPIENVEFLVDLVRKYDK